MELSELGRRSNDIPQAANRVVGGLGSRGDADRSALGAELL